MTVRETSAKRLWWRRLLTLGVIALVITSLFYQTLLSGYWKRAGRAALEESNPQRALDAFQRAARFDRSDAETQFLLARSYRRMGEFTEMESHLTSSLELGLSPARVKRERILAEAQIGTIQNPGKTLSELLLSPQGDEREICRAFVNGLCLNLKFKEAIQVLEAWHADFPDDAEPWFQRGIIQMSQKRWAPAEEAFREGLKLQPDRLPMRNHLANCLFEQQKFEQAQKQYRRVLEDSPDQIDAMFGLARCRAKLGDPTEARQLFEEVVSRDATHRPARHALARLELESNNPAAAVEWLSPYLEEEYPLPETSHLLAQAFAKSGKLELAEEYGRKFTEAQAHLDRLEELFDNIDDVQKDPDLRYEVGVLTYRYHSREEGLGWIQSVLLSAPNHRQAREFLQAHSRQIGRSEHE